MAYLKTHVDVFYILCKASTHERLILAIFVSKMDQGFEINCLEYKGGKRRQTLITALVQLTGIAKTHISHSLKKLRKSGLISSQKRFTVTLSNEFFSKTRGDLEEASYILPNEYSEIISRSKLYFKEPRLPKRNDDKEMIKKLMAELQEERKFAKEEREAAEKRHNELRAFLSRIEKKLPEEEQKEIKLHLVKK
jgi:predicted transcriptional regulator